ncbi:aldo/keto reductase [Streptomyces ficellus]|uniref:Aldo/keto reductase n=1 Tax=Streptomyces ficellus TaxID=1977088 RepID=A0A6I6FED1_9ACTN|nr:aldo/keto reductase [Streptomyces ficellus]QGV82383.1 aldo/keto reductase [Streptomyces ficellus]
MPARRIGGVDVSAIGLGAMPLSVQGRPDERQAIGVLHTALDAGITLIDTADAYHLDAGDPGHNESLIARALAAYGGDTSDVLVATKGGHTRPDGAWALDGSPEHLRRAADASLRRLGVEAIGLYQYHRPDPDVPYEESVGALGELCDAGKVRAVGISNADPAQIRLAHGMLGERLVAVQNQFSPSFRSSLPELELCDELGLAFLPWSPLGGMGGAGALGSRHGAFHEVAGELGVSPQRVCLAWMLALSPRVVPIPGARRPVNVQDCARAASLTLSPGQLARLNAAE